MKKRTFLLNSISSLGAQVITLICGFILPRLILRAYGTEVNGLVSSISQFLTVVSLSEFGMTAVVQSALYKPLADKNNEMISKILTSSAKFFRRIARLLIVYVLGLCLFYPVLVETNFDHIYIVLLIIILSINSLAQYLLGITNSQLISADQKVYVISISNIVTILFNTVMCYVLIRIGACIHVVKLTTAVIYLFKPFIAALYVKKNYSVNKNMKYDKEPIAQKWNGVAQHISYYVFTSTDVVVLTLCSNLANVSIYSVYILVLNGLKQLCAVLENGMKPILGELWARRDKGKLCQYFGLYEWFMHFNSIIVFGCAASLIGTFVKIYTEGVTDANYEVPLFALLITIAYCVQNIRNPYNSLIQAVGHYRQTQTNYIVVAVLNIVISVSMVVRFGLIGVTIGTLISAVYQMLWQAWYLYSNILDWKLFRILKQIFCDVVIYILGIGLCNLILVEVFDYFQWFLMAIRVGVIWVAVALIINSLFYHNQMLQIGKFIVREQSRKHNSG